MQLMNSSEAKGLLPFAEVAVQVETSPNGAGLLLTDVIHQQTFCPFQSKVGFHSIGKDWRNVSATDDDPFGSLWNKLLTKGALVIAFINLLHCLCNDCHLQQMSDDKLIWRYLHCYSLWSMRGATGLIGETFFKCLQYNSTRPYKSTSLVWSKLRILATTYKGCSLSRREVGSIRHN